MGAGEGVGRGCYFDSFGILSKIAITCQISAFVNLITYSLSILTELYNMELGEYGVYAPVACAPGIWLSDIFAMKGFFASFLLLDLLLTSIEISLFSYPFFFAHVLSAVLVDNQQI